MYIRMYGEKVRELMESKGMSKLDLAVAAGIAPETVLKVQREEPVMVDTAKKVAAALEVDPPQQLGRAVRRR